MGKGTEKGMGTGTNAKTEGSNFQIKFMIDLWNKRGAKRGLKREGARRKPKNMQIKSEERQRQASTFE